MRRGIYDKWSSQSRLPLDFASSRLPTPRQFSSTFPSPFRLPAHTRRLLFRHSSYLKMWSKVLFIFSAALVAVCAAQPQRTCAALTMFGLSYDLSSLNGLYARRHTPQLSAAATATIRFSLALRYFCVALGARILYLIEQALTPSTLTSVSR